MPCKDPGTGLSMTHFHQDEHRRKMTTRIVNRDSVEQATLEKGIVVSHDCGVTRHWEDACAMPTK